MPRQTTRTVRAQMTVVVGMLTLAFLVALGVYVVVTQPSAGLANTTGVSVVGPEASPSRRPEAVRFDIPAPDRPVGGTVSPSPVAQGSISAAPSPSTSSSRREPEPSPSRTRRSTPPPTRDPSPSPPPEERPVISFVRSGQMEDSFITAVRITNTTSKPLTWKLAFSYESAVVSGQWGAELSQAGKRITAKGLEGYSSVIPAGEEVVFGYSASGAPEAPGNCVLNGRSCRIG